MNTTLTTTETWSDVIAMMLAAADDDDDLLPDLLTTMPAIEARLALLAAIKIGGILIEREAAGKNEDAYPIIEYLVRVQKFLSE